jgi:hypothetical protein
MGICHIFEIEDRYTTIDRWSIISDNSSATKSLRAPRRVLSIIRACFLFYVKHVLQYVNGHAGNVSITTFSKICSVPVSILIIIKSSVTANENKFSVCSYNTIQFYSSINICQTYSFCTKMFDIDFYTTSKYFFGCTFVHYMLACFYIPLWSQPLLIHRQL